MKASMIANRDDTHTPHRLVDDLFAQLQERLTSGVDGPTAFKTLLIDIADYFDPASRGEALEILQKFGVPSGTPFSNFLRSFGVVFGSTGDKGGPLAFSPEMAMELIRIHTAQQYPLLMPTSFSGILATREKPYDSLTTLWTAFIIDGDAFASVIEGSGSHAHPMTAFSGSPIASTHRNARRTGRYDVSHSVSNVSQTHSRRDSFSVEYGRWPFDGRDYDIVCTVTNNIVNTNLSLWTRLLSEDARRQAYVQYRRRCCNCGSTKHSLCWCPASFKNTFLLLNPEFGTHDPDRPVLGHEKYAYVDGAKTPPPAVANVITDVMAHVTAAYVTLTTGDITRHTKVIRHNTRPRLCLCANFLPAINTQHPAPCPFSTPPSLRHTPNPTGPPNGNNHHVPPYGSHSHTP